MKIPSRHLFSLLAGLCLAGLDAQAATLSDTFPGPDLTTPVPGSHTGDTTTAAKDAGEPDHGFNIGGGSVWGTFSAPNPADAGVYIIDTIGSNFDTTLGIYYGDISAPQRLGANNNINGLAIPDQDSESRIYLPSGELVAIAVDGFEAGGIVPRGTVTLNIRKATTTDANDNLANATDLGNTAPVNATSSNLNASREIDEPIHGVNDLTAGTVWGGASVWLKWTAPETAEFNIATAGSTQTQTGSTQPLDTLLSVYTSGVPAPTYASLAVLAENNDVSGTDLTSRVRIAATSGTIYWIAVDGRNSVSSFQHRGSIQLSIVRSPDQSIFPLQSSWEYLNSPTDPSGVDVDFYTTWHDTAEGFTVAGATPYDGEPFASGPGLFAFDVIDFQNPPGTVLANKVTTYFRKKFTLATAASLVGIEFVIDDGAVFYIDSIERNRFNFGPVGGPPADLYAEFTPNGTTGAENVTTRLPLGSLAAGDHIIAVAVHDASAGSSDVGFDARLYTESRAPTITSALAATGSIGSPFTYTITVDPEIPASSYNATGLPGGLGINTSTGVISGTPTAQGNFNVTISATNGNGTDSETLLIAVGGPFGEVQLVHNVCVGTGFEEPARLAGSYVRGSNGTVEIGWSRVADTGNTGTADVRDPTVAGDHAAAGGTGSGPPHTPPPNKFFRLFDRFVQPFLSDKINISGLTAAQKQSIEVTIDIRTFTTSGTGFEDLDRMRIVVEGSSDGVTFISLGEILNVTGGATDNLMVYRSDTGAYTNLSSAGLVNITPDVNSIRLMIDGGADSTSEYIYLDNVCFVLGLAGETDTDGDGIPDAWESSHGLNPNDGADGSQDADRDGQTNRQEYSADTDPQSPHSRFGFTSQSLAANTQTIRFELRPNRVYIVQRATDLGGWQTFSTVGPEANPRTVTITDPATNQRTQYRVLVTP